MNEEFYGISKAFLEWMKMQWRECKDKDEQLKIFEDMTGATEQEIIDVLEPGYCPERKPFNSNTKWTEEEDARLLSMRKAGKTCKEIAAELRRTMAAVQSRYILIKNHDAEDGEPGIITADVDTDVVPLEDAPESEVLPEKPDVFPDGGALPLEIGELPGADALEAVGGTLRALLDEEEMLCDRLAVVRDTLAAYRAKLKELLMLAGGGLT